MHERSENENRVECSAKESSRQNDSMNQCTNDRVQELVRALNELDGRSDSANKQKNRLDDELERIGGADWANRRRNRAGQRIREKAFEMGLGNGVD
jgi:hypothetical protein